MSDSLRPHGLYSPWNSPGQNIGVGSLFLLQEIFQSQGSNPGLLYCKQILHQLSHKESPRILEWVTYPFSKGSSLLRNQSRVSSLKVDSLPRELSGNQTFQNLRLSPFSLASPNPFQCFSDGYHCFSKKFKLKIPRHLSNRTIIQ